MSQNLTSDFKRKLDFRDVLIRPSPTTLASRALVNIVREFVFPRSGEKWTCVPIIASNMDSTGTPPMAKALSKFKAATALSKFCSVDRVIKTLKGAEGDFTFYSLGIVEEDFDKLKQIKSKVAVKKICIDVANGYMKRLEDAVHKVRSENKNSVILAGSVCTPEMTVKLIRAGADIVRVGIGSGSVCTTRKLTGVGYPQLSAVIECSAAAHEEKGFVCSDGGCTIPGDICKAFGGGADFVMLGGMLAGHEECDGKIKYRKIGKKKIPVGMEFYGMASELAQKKHFGKMASYRAAEGKVVTIPYRGDVAETIREILGGLRSMMTYIDARQLADIPSKCSFIRVGSQLNTVYGG